MLSQTTRASTSQKPNHTYGKCGGMAFANAFACLSQAKGVSWPVVVSNWICVVKQIRVEGKVTSLCGYLLVTCKRAAQLSQRQTSDQNHSLIA
jgi:dihydroxyacid dehydratase/phosphogluconate dehydratase